MTSPLSYYEKKYISVLTPFNSDITADRTSLSHCHFYSAQAKRFSQYEDFLSDWIRAERSINLHYLIFTYSY